MSMSQENKRYTWMSWMLLSTESRSARINKVSQTARYALPSKTAIHQRIVVCSDVTILEIKLRQIAISADLLVRQISRVGPVTLEYVPATHSWHVPELAAPAYQLHYTGSLRPSPMTLIPP